MVKGRESFWTVVYAMFRARDITRSDLRQIIEKGLRQTGGSYKLLAGRFNMPQEDYKRFLGFLRQYDCQVPFQPFRAASGRRWRRKLVSGVMQARLADWEGRFRRHAALGRHHGQGAAGLDEPVPER